MSCAKVVGHSLGARSASDFGQAIPTAASRSGMPQRALSVSIVTYSTMQGIKAYGTSCLFAFSHVVGVVAEIGMGIRSKVSLVLAYSAGSPST